MTEESEVGTLVQASAKGDEAAWNALVRRYAPLVLAVIRSYQLAAADVVWGPAAPPCLPARR